MSAPAVARASAERLADVLWILILAAVAATPLVLDVRGFDVFRLPKTVFFQASALLITSAAAAGLLLSETFRRNFPTRFTPTVVAAAAVVWVAIVSMTAIVPATARSAPYSLFCHAALFVVAMGLARGRSLLPALAALLVPAIVNAAIVLLQAFDIWQPFVIAPGARLGTIGLVGNPNTVSTYLLLPTVAAIAAAIAVRRHRIVFIALAVLFVFAIIRTETITAYAGLGAAFAALAVTASRRVRILAVASLVAGVVIVLAYSPTRQRLQSLAETLRKADYNTLTSGRVPAAAVALRMFSERPVVGFGPGGYSARYMPYRLAIEESHPEWIEDIRSNFGEAHNDHAQMLAETGAPGYALFLLFVVLLARGMFRAPAADTRAEFARRFALPAVAALVVVALGQFPLELTAVTAPAVFASALCFAWRVE